MRNKKPASTRRRRKKKKDGEGSETLSSKQGAVCQRTHSVKFTTRLTPCRIRDKS